MNKSLKAFFLFLSFIILSTGITLATPLVESVAISGDKLIVTGHQFLDIDGLILSDPKTGFKKPFKVESATESEIVGTAVDDQKITVASLMNLIIDTAKGETIYPVSFNLQKDAVTNPTIKDGAITPEKFIGVTTPPADQSVLTWNEATQSFVFAPTIGPGGTNGGYGVSDIVLGAGITGAPNTASGSVPISVDIGATGNTSKTKIPYFNSKNKIVLDSTSSPVGAITGLSFKDGTQNFTISNDNALRIDSNAFLDLLVLGVNGNLSLKGPVTVGGFEVCLSSGNCSSDSVAGVSSFKTRTGAVVPAAGDYTATLVTSTAGGSVSATTVQAAIQELDTEKLPKAGGTMTGTITTSTQNALKIGPAGSVTGEVQFLEPAANGTNYVGFKSPASLATNTVWTLPAVDGTSGQVLSTNGSKVLSWTSAGAGGTGNVVGPASAKATNVATYSDATGKVLLDSGIASTNIATMAANATAQFQPILSGGIDKSQVAAPYTFPDKNCLPGEVLKWNITGFTCQADLGGLTSVQGDTSPLPLATLDTTIPIYSGEDGQTIKHSYWKLNGIQLEGPTAFIGENSTFKGMNVGCFSNMLFNSSSSYGFCQDSTGDASLGTTNKVDFNVGGTTKLSVGSTVTTHSQHLVNTGNLVVDSNTFFVNSATNVVGIGTTGPVQVLEINSTTKGFLPPRMSTAQKNAITPQSTGLVVFDTDLNSLNVRNSAGWTSLGSGGAGAGDVAGPASAKATNLATFADATGKVLADSAISSSDLVTMSGAGSPIAGNVVVTSGGKLVADSTINLSNIPTMPANATLANQPILGVAGQKVQVAAPYTLPNKNCTAGQILKWDDAAVGFTCQSGGGLASVPGDTSPLPLATLDTTIPIYSGEDGQTIKHSYWKLNGIQLEGPTAFIGENSVFKGLNVGCFSNKLFNSSNSYGFCQDTTGDASLGTTNKVDFNVGGNTKLAIGATITTHNNHLVNNGNLVVDTNTFFVNSATNNVGIGTTNPIQAFQVDSTTKGFLPPRMTTTQKNLINPQTPGMMVFDTTMNSLSLRTTDKWVLLGSSSFATFGAPMSSLSDLKLKKNIKSLDLDVFEVLDKLNPVSFEWKNQLKGLRGDGPQFGFVAQEVEKVLPNLVITNDDGNKGVNEIAMIPLLMDAIKKQQKQIAELQGKGPADDLMTNLFNGNDGKPVGAAPTVREPAGTTYTLSASDCGNNVALNNASAITVSVPALAPGCEIEIVQTGAGQVKVTGAGIKVGNIFGLYKTRGQYSVVTVKLINSALAVLVGDVN